MHPPKMYEVELGSICSLDIYKNSADDIKKRQNIKDLFFLCQNFYHSFIFTLYVNLRYFKIKLFDLT